MNENVTRPTPIGPALQCFSEEILYQIEKHGFTRKYHREHPEFYQFGQLAYAARELSKLDPDLISSVPPTNWDQEWWHRLTKKSLQDRLIISGTFIAGQYDYLFYNESK